LGSGFDADEVRTALTRAVDDVRAFAPGFSVAACTVTDDRVFVAVEVAAAGDRIPRHVGNLDIINSAAVLVAEGYASRGVSTVTTGVS
ncbi:acetaldehyde dehydrogenase (acetylating), partial [Streptomyces albidoflavus]